MKNHFIFFCLNKMITTAQYIYAFAMLIVGVTMIIQGITLLVKKVDKEEKKERNAGMAFGSLYIIAGLYIVSVLSLRLYRNKSIW